MRNLTVAQTAEVDKSHGQFLIQELTIAWTSGSVTYTPAEFLRTQREGEANAFGGVNDISWELNDGDREVVDLIEAEGATLYSVQVRLLHRWDSVAGDVTLFHGLIDYVEINTAKRSVSFRATSWESRYRAWTGIPIVQEVFPDAPPCVHIGDPNFVPLVYGSSVRRVPSPLIDEPGRARLRQLFEFTDDRLYIDRTAAGGRFTTGSAGSPITIEIGIPGNTENLTGYFTSSTSDEFNVLTRSRVLSETLLARIVTVDGFEAIWIPEDPPNVEQGGLNGRLGYCFSLDTGSGWVSMLVTFWQSFTHGTNGDGVAIAFHGNLGLSDATDYRVKLSTVPNMCTRWPSGVHVVEHAPHVFAANMIPSQSVDRVEVFQRQTPSHAAFVPDGIVGWFTYEPAHYTVNLDNRSFNSALGRLASEGGITTVSISPPPIALGMQPVPYVTLTTPSGKRRPAEAVLDMLLTVAGIPSALIDSASFTTAQSDADSDGRDCVTAAAIEGRQEVFQVAAELAAQATLRLSNQDGILRLDAVPRFGVVDALPDLTRDSFAANYSTRQVSTNDRPTRWEAAVPRFPNDDQPDRLVSVDASGRRPVLKESEWSMFQLGSEAAKAQLFWHDWLCRRTETVRLTAFVKHFRSQPLDVFTLSAVDLDASSGITDSITSTIATHELTLSADVFNSGVSSITSANDGCSLTPHPYPGVFVTPPYFALNGGQGPKIQPATPQCVTTGPPVPITLQNQNCSGTINIGAGITGDNQLEGSTAIPTTAFVQTDQAGSTTTIDAVTTGTHTEEDTTNTDVVWITFTASAAGTGDIVFWLPGGINVSTNTKAAGYRLATIGVYGQESRPHADIYGEFLNYTGAPSGATNVTDQATMSPAFQDGCDVFNTIGPPSADCWASTAAASDSFSPTTTRPTIPSGACGCSAETLFGGDDVTVGWRVTVSGIIAPGQYIVGFRTLTGQVWSERRAVNVGTSADAFSYDLNARTLTFTGDLEHAVSGTPTFTRTGISMTHITNFPHTTATLAESQCYVDASIGYGYFGTFSIPSPPGAIYDLGGLLLMPLDNEGGSGGNPGIWTVWVRRISDSQWEFAYNLSSLSSAPVGAPLFKFTDCNTWLTGNNWGFRNLSDSITAAERGKVENAGASTPGIGADVDVEALS